LSSQPLTRVVTGADGVSREQEFTNPPARQGGGRRRKPMQPIEGPSAFGGDRRRFMSLLWITAVQDYRLMYRNSLLGYVWTLLRPLLFFAVLYLVFTRVIRFGNAVPDYAVLLLMNIMLFQFFIDASSSAMGSVVRGEPLVRKMHFPRIVIPLANVITAFMTSLMNFVVVIGFFLASGVEPIATWLLLPVIMATLFVFSASVAILLSTAYVWFRDLDHIWGVLTRVLFYTTPILFPLEFVPESFRWIITLNPLTPILYEARVLLVQPDAPSLTELVGVAPVIGSVIVGIGLLVGALSLFIRQAPRVAEAL